MRQIPLAIAPAPAQTFGDFLLGRNAAAVAHLQGLSARLAQPRQEHPSPTYIWGPPGCGKTHLLHAVVHVAQAQGQRAGWFSAARPLPWSFDDQWSLLVLDDCDGLDEAQQQAAFALFVEAVTHAVQIVASGAVPPVDLALRDDLRSRLGWGNVYAVLPLSERDSRAALRREADRRGIVLSDEVLDFLLTRFSRDLPHLMALLERLDEYSLARHRAVTVPLLKQLFDDEDASP